MIEENKVALTDSIDKIEKRFKKQSDKFKLEKEELKRTLSEQAEQYEHEI